MHTIDLLMAYSREDDVWAVVVWAMPHGPVLLEPFVYGSHVRCEVSCGLEARLDPFNQAELLMLGIARLWG